MKVLQLKAFINLTCLDFGMHSKHFPRLKSGKTFWKRLKKSCPGIVRLRLGSMENGGANISHICDAFGPQLKEFQIKVDFKARSSTLLLICHRMFMLETLTLASAPNVWKDYFFFKRSGDLRYIVHNDPKLCFRVMPGLQYLRHIDFSFEYWMQETYSCNEINLCLKELSGAGGIPTLETCRLDHQYEVSIFGIWYLVEASSQAA